MILKTHYTTFIISTIIIMLLVGVWHKQVIKKTLRNFQARLTHKNKTETCLELRVKISKNNNNNDNKTTPKVKKSLRSV